MAVQTIAGRLNPEELGVTYVHEHLWSDPPQWLAEQDPDLVLKDIHAAALEVELFKSVGGGCIVDMTALDYGRNIKVQATIATMTGINLVVTTGFNKGLFFPKWVHQASEQQIADWMLKELTQGIEGTQYRAGIIKVGTGYNTISEVEKKVIRAAAIAHRETGAPIAAHTEAGTMSLEQLDYMESLDVHLDQVIIAHADRNIDLWIMKQIARRGAYVEFDGPSKIKYYPDQMRVDAIVALVQAGYQEKILISGDMARKSYLEAFGGGPGFRYIITKFIPRLEAEFAERGLEPNLVSRFLTANPQGALQWRS